MSFKAKGILLVILSNKEDWRVYPHELAQRAKDSITSVRTGLEELEQAGYIRTYKKSFGRGKGIEHFRFCSDKKITDEIFKELVIDLEKELQN